MVGLGDVSGAAMKVEFVSVCEIRMVTVTLNRKASERRTRLLKQRKCLGCEMELTEAQSVIRGLCSSCYQSARYYMTKRKTTQEQLIQDGKMLPVGKRGRRPKSAIARELSQK